MSEQEKTPIRIFLKEEYATLKSSRDKIKAKLNSPENTLKRTDVLAEEVQVINDQGAETKQLYVLLGKLKGETISDETLEVLKKYMNHLVGQKESLEKLIEAEKAVLKSNEDSQELEDFL